MDLSKHKTLRVKNGLSEMLVELLNLSAGLDFAIESLNEGEISNKARDELRELIGKTYIAYSYRLGLQILKSEGIAKSADTIADYHFVFDTPDDDHDDLIIEYRRLR